MLLGFVLAFLSAYGLARHLTGHPGAAVTAAIAFAFCPFVFARSPHIQLMLTVGMPLSLLCLHRFVQTSTPRRAVQLGLALFVQAMACAYYGIFAGLAVATGVLFYATVRKRWTDRRYWSGVVLGAAVSVGLVTPFFLPYWDLRAAGFNARSTKPCSTRPTGSRGSRRARGPIEGCCRCSAGGKTCCSPGSSRRPWGCSGSGWRFLRDPRDRPEGWPPPAALPHRHVYFRNIKIRVLPPTK